MDETGGAGVTRVREMARSDDREPGIARLEDCLRRITVAEASLVEARLVLQQELGEYSDDGTPPWRRTGLKASFEGEALDGKHQEEVPVTHTSSQMPREMRSSRREGQQVESLLLDQVVMDPHFQDTAGSAAILLPAPFRAKMESAKSIGSCRTVGESPLQYLRTRCRCPLVHPDRLGLLIWKLVGAAFVVYLLFAIPFCLAFEDECQGPVSFVVNSIINVYFISDVVLNFCTGYTDEETGRVVMKPRNICRRYAQGWLVLDVVSAIPWDWLPNEEGSGYQVTKAFRLFRTFSALSVVRLFHFKRLSKFKDKVGLLIEDSPVLIFAVGALRVLLMLFAVTHCGACAWYMVGVGDSDDHLSWVKAHVPDAAGSLERYIWSVYFTLTTMTTVGYGDIVATNYSEVCCVLMLLLIAAIVFPGLMGTIADLISALNASSRADGERRRVLSQYMSWREVPRSLFLRIREHLLFRWAACDGNESFEHAILEELSPVLKRELLFHIYGRALRSAPFLAWMHQASLKDLAMRVETRMMSRGDYLFHIGDANAHIFILLQGSVHLSLNESLYEEPAHKPHDVGLGAIVKHLVHQKHGKHHRHHHPHHHHHGRSTFSSPILHDAITKLRRREAMDNWAARVIQHRWRRKLLRCLEREVPQRLPQPAAGRGKTMMRSHNVEAPAYFGEACLWVPLDEWTSQPPPSFKYSARCECRVEVVFIDREVIREIVEHKTWQKDRLEFFRNAVLEGMEAKHATGSRNVFNQTAEEWMASTIARAFRKECNPISLARQTSSVQGKVLPRRHTMGDLRPAVRRMPSGAAPRAEASPTAPSRNPLEEPLLG